MRVVLEQAHDAKARVFAQLFAPTSQWKLLLFKDFRQATARAQPHHRPPADAIQVDTMKLHCSKVSDSNIFHTSKVIGAQKVTI